jgi:EAL domain-containing protein (putative c-di-GMP-specific phosphodiesterase class I)/DNA-binding NarL/FixJ family response regulator
MADPTPSDARILVIDDEESNLLLLRHMLQRAGYQYVETVNDSSVAMEHFLEFQPDLVLLDLHMPEPDGFAILALIREAVSVDDIVPVLVLTADVTVDATEVALGIGAHDLLTKPFNYPELLLRVRNLLGLRAVHTRVQRHDAAVTQVLEVKQRVDDLDRQRRADIGGRIDRVLAGDGLTMVFQPVVDLIEGRIVGAEALSRFSAEPLQAPDLWFLEAAEIDRAVELEMYAIRRALDGLDQLPAGTFLSLNASAETLASADLARCLAMVPALRVVIELTEHELILDYEPVVSAIDTLRDRGVRVAVDDTGSGYASLSHILKLAPDVIKLDRDLITGVDTDPVRRSLIASMVHFASETGTQLIGEGVETEDELIVLRALGLSHAQGFLLAAPGPLPLNVAPLQALRTPMPGPPATLNSPHDSRPIGVALHDGPAQELSAACLRLQLMQQGTTDERTRAELAIVIGGLRRGAAQLSDITGRLAGSTVPGPDDQ